MTFILSCRGLAKVDSTVRVMDHPSLLSIFAFFVLVVAPLSHAAFSPQVYWKTVLPNTPMPTALSELLYTEGKTGTSVYTGKGGVHVSTGKGTTVGVGHGTVGVHAPGKPGGTGTNVGVGHGGVYVHTDPKKKPVVVNAGPFQYLYAATDEQINANRDIAVFFVEKDLHAGKKFTLHFTRTVTGAAFIPRDTAEKMPFSSKKLPEILSTFKIKSNSDDSRTMATTVRDCETPAVEGETRACVTSLESMVDFSTSSIGTRDVIVRSTTVEEENAPKQVYTVSGVKSLKAGGDNTPVVACHAEPYVYAVFFCHKTKKSRAYEVTMTAADGSKVDAVAVCHTDTSKWNPKHLAFQLLDVKPGTVPVCHFLPQDHVVWAPAK